VSRKHFGTDGVRGVANEMLTPEFALALGQAAGRWLVESGEKPRIAMGRDTRKSGPMLGSALASGFCSVGVDVVAMGVAPTGGVSFVARTGEFGMGAVISASHNPAPDNGIKFVGHDGCKLADEAEEEIEAFLDRPIVERVTGAGVGELETDRSEVSRYMRFLESLVPEGLEGLNIAVDGSHGAAYELGPEVLRALGANVRCIGVAPDGMNINAGYGATKPEAVQEFTKANGLQFGVAFDGDADRAVFSDEQGRLINGDRTMAIWCAHWAKQGTLSPPVVVGTVMSNGGFEKYMVAQGIRVERTPVGDKHVAAKLRETGGKVGGEQSGHIIFPECGPTGDGLVTALQILRVLKREGRPASEFYGDYESWPQLLVNVKVRDQKGWDSVPLVKDALSTASATVDGHGRIVVRASGTQPMIRVMVEADEVDRRDRAAAAIVDALQSELSGEIYSRVDLTYALGD
jgi:phosphoglucosamine mutase